MMCRIFSLYFIHKWRDLQFKDDFERHFLRNFMSILFTLRDFASNVLRGNLAKEIFFVFYFHVWPAARTLALYLISQHITYQTTATSVNRAKFFLNRTKFVLNGALLSILHYPSEQNHMFRSYQQGIYSRSISTILYGKKVSKASLSATQ